MNTRTLTSANCTFLLTVSPIFPAAVKISGFSADDITDMDAITPKESVMGIDGRLSAGYVPVPITQNIMLQADSLSNDFFDGWANYERSTRETYFAQGSLIVPATEKVYVLTRGVLTNFAPIPALRRTLQPRRFSIVWQGVIPTPNL